MRTILLSLVTSAFLLATVKEAEARPLIPNCPQRIASKTSALGKCAGKKTARARTRCTKRKSKALADTVKLCEKYGSNGGKPGYGSPRGGPRGRK